MACVLIVVTPAELGATKINTVMNWSDIWHRSFHYCVIVCKWALSMHVAQPINKSKEGVGTVEFCSAVTSHPWVSEKGFGKEFSLRLFTLVVQLE